MLNLLVMMQGMDSVVRQVSSLWEYKKCMVLFSYIYQFCVLAFVNLIVEKIVGEKYMINIHM